MNDVSPSLLVLLQFALIFCVVISGPLTLPVIFFLFPGLLLGFWAVVTMHHHGILRIRPDVALHSKLVILGPYRLIRHPMYTGIILSGIGLTLGAFTWFRLLCLVFLVCVLIIKSGYEETRLLKVFPQYCDYVKKSFRFFPYVY